MTEILDAVLGLGSNLGNRRKMLASAIDLLTSNPDIEVVALAPIYESEPWGMRQQGDFLNTAARIRTALKPRRLLEAILAAEASLGRKRRERWGPRKIDIDILYIDGIHLEAPGLVVPHPHLAERNFALAPLVDVMPEAKLDGTPASSILANIGRKGLRQVAGPRWHQQSH